ncbi:hypothetical protein M3D60_004765 [Micrococcus luteus]|uniref:hypothetical protein n=2 Tax=Micrococcus TaxID=1269 RepID=UPI000DE8F98C|nr:hypothetical protein [Micrococcus luteus]RBO83715.1 hypothetical protein DE149_11814 [Micrococcus sp. KT16]VXB53146.1 conserved exported hypothetical protein [Micrococcus luteus]
MSESTSAAPQPSQSVPSRRRVASSLAWAVPTVVAAAAAPAEAASPPPRIDRVFQLTLAPGVPWTEPKVSPCASTLFTNPTRLSVTTDNSAFYYRITNLRADSTVTDVTASVLVQKSVVDKLSNGLTWTSETKDWSNPTLDVSGAKYIDNGIEYYRYYSTLRTAVPAPVSGTITLPRIQWYSNCSTNLLTQAQSTGVMANGRGSAVVNGTPLVNVGTYVRLTPRPAG